MLKVKHTHDLLSVIKNLISKDKKVGLFFFIPAPCSVSKELLSGRIFNHWAQLLQ